MKWAHCAHTQDYDFNNPLSYQTVLSQMTSKYRHVSGGPPKSEVVSVPGYAPVHVYCFDFLQQASCLLLDENLMKDSLWGYNEKIHPVSGKRVYAEMNTGDFWKLGDDYVENRVNALDPSLCVDGLKHHFCPVILFIDSTLVDRIG